MRSILTTLILVAAAVASAQGSDASNVRSTAAGVWSISLPTEPAEAPIAVILPGLGGNPWTVNDSRSRFQPLLRGLTGAGYAVVVPGASGETHWGNAQAVTATVAQLRDVHAAYPNLGRDVVLIGESMGNLLARHLLSGEHLKQDGWNVKRYVAIDPVMSLWAAYKTPALTAAVRWAYPDLPTTPALAGWQASSASNREPGGLAWLNTVPTTIVASRTDAVTPWRAQAAPFITTARSLQFPLNVIEVKGPHVDASHFSPTLILPLLR